MRAGQTLALAGLIQNRLESQNKGIPFLGDLPLVGRAFSRIEEHVNEVELMIMVTPELIAPLDPHQVPQCGPGQLSASPNDHEFYSYGYPEVPNCCLGQKKASGGPATCPPPSPTPSSVEMPNGDTSFGTQVPPPATVPLRAPALPVPTDRRISTVSHPDSPTGPRLSAAADTPGGPVFGPLGYDPLR